MKAAKINAKWHAANRMPRGATKDQRVRWHAEHSQECGCRPVPAGIKPEVAALMKKTQSA